MDAFAAPFEALPTAYNTNAKGATQASLSITSMGEGSTRRTGVHACISPLSERK